MSFKELYMICLNKCLRYDFVIKNIIKLANQSNNCVHIVDF